MSQRGRPFITVSLENLGGFGTSSSSVRSLAKPERKEQRMAAHEFGPVGHEPMDMPEEPADLAIPPAEEPAILHNPILTGARRPQRSAVRPWLMLIPLAIVVAGGGAVWAYMKMSSASQAPASQQVATADTAAQPAPVPAASPSAPVAAAPAVVAAAPAQIPPPQAAAPVRRYASAAPARAHRAHRASAATGESADTSATSNDTAPSVAPSTTPAAPAPMPAPAPQITPPPPSGTP
jgi:hypothetical protein